MSSLPPRPEPVNVEPSAVRCIGCGYDLSGTALGSTCPECGRPVVDSVSSGAVQDRLGYVGPALVTIFCCVIGGLLALVYTAKANSAAAAGDPAGFQSHKKTRDVWMIISVVLGLLAILSQVGFAVFP